MVVTRMWTRSSCGLLVGAALVVGPAPLLAQASEPPTVEVDVRVEAILPEEIRETPGAATVLTDAQLQFLRPYTLHDALSFMPGVRTIDDDVLGRRSGIGLRGAPPRRSRKTLLLEDGTPINASTYLDPSAHYTPPIDRLERVEVLKGTGHILHGPLNNHGIINFRNKQPTLVPETAVDLGLGNQGTFRRHILHRRTTGPIGLVLSYTGADAEGAFDVEDHQYDDVFGSLRWAVNARHDLSVSSTFFRERSHYDESNLTPEEFAVAPRTKEGRFSQELNTIGVNYRKLDIVHDARPSGRLAISTKAFVTNLDRPRFTVDPGESPVDLLPAVEAEDPFVPGLVGQMVARDRHYRTYGAETRMVLAGSDGPEGRHRVQWGLRAERHQLNDRRRAGADGEILELDNRGPIVRDDAYRATAVSMFVEDAIHAGRWTVTPGLRVERYTQSKQPLPSQDEGPEGGERERDVNTLVLPSISVLYEPSSERAVFANVGRGYTPAFARTAAEFPLEPETGINSQVGVRSHAVRGVSFEGAIFFNKITDTVVQLPFTIDNQNIFLNSEDSISYGVDAGLRVNSTAYTSSPLNLFGEIAYTYSRATFTAGLVDGRRVPEVPLNSGSVTVGAEHASGWHVSATVSHMGAFFTDPSNIRALTLADEDGEFVSPGDEFDLREPVVFGEVPAHTLLSARVNIPVPTTQAVIWVQGRNLTNALYILDLANGLRPGAARTVAAGVRFAF